MQTAVLVLAAGRGERLGQPVPKGLVKLRGRTLLARSVDTLLTVSEIDWIVPVVPADYVARRAELDLPADPRVRVPIPGGKERQDSVAEGLAALPEGAELVAVHDAARCLVSADEVRRVLAAARSHRAALLAIPAHDTIKRVRGGVVCETPPRDECFVAQTPQAFHTALLREALATARADGFAGTDDAQLVERLGVAVHVVTGSARNLKITRPADLALAERLLDEDEAVARAGRGSGVAA